MSFLVVWETGEQGYYCLFNDFGEAPVRCWSEARRGETTDERTVQENFSYWMTDRDLASRLAVATVAEFIAEASKHLASYQKPKSVDFVDALPKAPTGKILKRELRDPYWQDQTRQV